MQMMTLFQIIAYNMQVHSECSILSIQQFSYLMSNNWLNIDIMDNCQNWIKRSWSLLHVTVKLKSDVAGTYSASTVIQVHTRYFQDGKIR